MAGNDGKKRTEDVGIGYKASYTDRKTGADVGYLKLYIRPAILNGLEPNARGVIELSAFPMTGAKKSEKSPDIVIKPTLKKKKVAAHATGTDTAKSDFPF